eukprot:389697-Karenia_brevis.AAC.1
MMKMLMMMMVMVMVMMMMIFPVPSACLLDEQSARAKKIGDATPTSATRSQNKEKAKGPCSGGREWGQVQWQWGKGERRNARRSCTKPYHTHTSNYSQLL